MGTTLRGAAPSRPSPHLVPPCLRPFAKHRARARTRHATTRSVSPVKRPQQPQGPQQGGPHQGQAVRHKQEHRHQHRPREQERRRRFYPRMTWCTGSGAWGNRRG
ncbi:hypothetical protein I4F81_010067 [Pyropia yezoensis]|uniref:Uncharacterized protein n=1 Tax=Pyropia yezoensis TaxID=2788 RepID=A0ACC3CCS3_PYRYE|nr:hypothetical protein I4F81_010067 [Neopyropia yezoensis]